MVHNMDDVLKKVLETGKTLSDIARTLFGSASYYNREKSKKILLSNGIEWEVWLSSKKVRKFCRHCGKEITGKDKRNVFCSHSCSAKYNNKRKRKSKREARCLNCGKSINSRNKFCNNTCYSEYKQKDYIKRWKEGNENGLSGKFYIISAIRRYILEKNQYKCENCGTSYVNPYTNNSILQIHHIDGDCTNNKEDNLQLLCPNCHAMTENYGRRNKNATRKKR